jgi:hypothetical protein
MILSFRTRHAPRFLLAIALGAAGCSGADETARLNVDTPAAAAPQGHVVGAFVAHVSPKNGTFEIVSASKAPKPPGVAPESLDDLTIDVDGTPNTTNNNVNNVVELVTNTVDVCPATLSSTDSFCANVTTRSFYNTRGLSNVYLYVVKMTDAVGNDTTQYAGKNSDASFSSLGNALGLWRYTGDNVTSSGVLAAKTATNQGGNAGTRDIAFARGDGGDFYVYFHVYATLTYSTYSMSALTAGVPATNNACTQGGTKLLGQSGGTATTSVNLPFPFTFYGTTYTPGAANAKLAVTRYGAMGFGAASTNTGTNIALPSGAGTAFKPGIFPFWENLNYTVNNTTVTNSPSGVCTLTAGTEPNRTLLVTWHDMKFTNDSSAIYPGSPNVTFSAILHEGSDVIDFVYGVMLNGTASRANGGVATVGVQNDTGTVATAKNSVAGSVAANSMYTLTPQP